MRDINTDACHKEAEELGKYGKLDSDCLMAVWLTTIPQKCAGAQVCDVTSWDDQASLFEEAIKFSPSGTIDIVVANAGLGALGDPLVQPGDLSGPATKPDLRILEHIKSKMIEAVVEFAETEDAVKAVMRIATDSSVNGRSLGVLSRDRAPQGYIDLDSDDYREGGFFYPMEQLALSIKFG
ncbi:hypothetical protein INS49_004816 [Diaporthe citri]|uniref:uncharacterized protein n=1 Tax=Diaporthe citri TaxID=83186 RepID=UPI001C80F3C9|nr:uncharacterized protein INS49_004816 [Diaporthe citri]KAG6354212.1 hypothetical protein INS49_004816 [Diaporthe citri]